MPAVLSAGAEEVDCQAAAPQPTEKELYAAFLNDEQQLAVFAQALEES